MEIQQENLFGEKEYVEDGRKVEMFSEAEIAEAAFQMFREKGFPYPFLEKPAILNQMNELANLPLANSLHNTLGYRVADTYNKHRFHAAAYGKRSVYEGFLDDKALRKVIRKHMEGGDPKVPYTCLGFFSLVNGVQGCSNFRPAYARLMYNKYAPVGGKVLDPCTGYGGRLVGFLASHCSEYHGVDPNTVTHAANTKMANDLKKNKIVKLYNFPFEDVDLSAYPDYFDLSFTSPPYFTKEHYSDEDTQSCNRYPEYERWAEFFLKPMMFKNFYCVKQDGYCIVNINDVAIDGDVHPLVTDTIRFGKEAGFAHIRNDVFMLNPRVSSKGGVKTVSPAAKEIVILLRKINATNVKKKEKDKHVDETELKVLHYSYEELKTYYKYIAEFGEIKEQEAIITALKSYLL